MEVNKQKITFLHFIAQPASHIDLRSAKKKKEKSRGLKLISVMLKNSNQDAQLPLGYFQ